MQEATEEGEALPRDAGEEEDGEPGYKEVPHYTEDYNAAFEVVEKMRDDGWLFTIKALPPESSYLFEGSRGEFEASRKDRLGDKGLTYCKLRDMRDGLRTHGRKRSALESTVPLAICRTVLRALGLEK